MNKIPVIFLAYANVSQLSEDYLQNLIGEKKETREALDKARRAGICEVVIRDNATIEDVISVFQDEAFKNRIAIFHFSGHANSYSLILDTPFRKKNEIYADGLASFLGTQPSLQLAFLNGCSTKKQAKEFLKNGIRSVVASEVDIKDDMAKDLAVHFYNALGNGFSIRDAFRQAKGLLQATNRTGNKRGFGQKGPHDHPENLPWQLYHLEGDEQVLEWSIPLAADQPLWALPKIDANYPKPIQPYPGLRPYQREEATVFWGRDHEIVDLYKALSSKNCPELILVYGSTGIGKTSLLLAGLLPYLEREHQAAYFAWSGAVEVQLSQLSGLIDDLRTDRGYAIVLLDIIENREGKRLVTFIQDQCSKHPYLRFLVSTRTNWYDDWLEFIGQKLNFTPYYVPNLSARSIQQILLGGAKNDLITHYRAEIDIELMDQLAMQLSADPNACIPPVLQYLAERIWKAALLENNQHPPINKNLWHKLNKDGLWDTFLTQQLANITEPTERSGLILNLLKEHLRSNFDNPNFTVEELSAQFRDKEGQVIPVLLEQLVAQRILTTPTLPQTNQRQSYRLVHQVLEIPLFNSLNNSQKPGQEIPRILINRLRQGDDLSEGELGLIKQFNGSIPTFSEAESEKIRHSELRLKNQKSNRRIRQGIRVFLAVLLISLGYLFADNPYLLLYFLLLFIVYHFSKSILEKIKP